MRVRVKDKLKGEIGLLPMKSGCVGSREKKKLVLSIIGDRCASWQMRTSATAVWWETEWSHGTYYYSPELATAVKSP